MRAKPASSATSQATSKLDRPSEPGSSGSGASRVQITNPSADGSPEATPSWNGELAKRASAPASANGTSATAPAAAARRLNSRRVMRRVTRAPAQMPAPSTKPLCSGAACETRECGGTLCVSQTLPPMMLPWPTVTRPSTVALA